MTNLSPVMCSTDRQANVSHFDLDDAYVREADEILRSSSNAIPDFWIQRYESNNSKNWDTFYKHNQANFFKDRHYISDEFGLVEAIPCKNMACHLVDLGCGVGNALIPLLKEFPGMTATGFDCSETAVKLLQAKLRSQELEKRCSVEVGDMTDPARSYESLRGTADFALLFFVQSAIAPCHYERIQELAWSILKPGGVLLFRDYGKYDMAQLRFERSAGRQGNKISDDFYVRGDGTRAKFFTENELRTIWEKDQRFKTDQMVLHTKKFVNRRTSVEMKRVWIQAKWIRI
jgi:SAM-dependent methyltransferase